jgi:aubergine-like protein
MFDALHNNEIQQCLDALEALNISKKCGLTFIVIQKRNNTRFFRKNELTGEYENPIPGTVVDKGIVSQEQQHQYDFFLVSQETKQGTVTPSHYHVIYDIIHLKREHIQQLCFKLCHTYSNWPGTVRSPAPCGYAHKMAFQNGQFINDNPNPNLKDKLYFL